MKIYETVHYFNVTELLEQGEDVHYIDKFGHNGGRVNNLEAGWFHRFFAAYREK